MSIILPALLLGADRCTKFLAQKGKLPAPMLDGQLTWEHVENTGCAGGLGREEPQKVTALNAVAAAALAASFTALPSGSRAESTGRWLVLMGTGSNLYDRWEHGSVTDMIRFPKAPGTCGKLVWNVADFMILSGTALCMLGRRKR